MLTAALVCMALTVYHEGRGEPIAGQHAIAHVIMNRVADPRWPSSICKVTRQYRQFSWIGKANPLPANPDAWAKAVLIAQDAINHRSRDNTDGATDYHNTTVDPYWSDGYIITRHIGNHIFYRRK